jgi:alpha-L-fucosidase 2
MVLWYRSPAKGWNEALPIGNGRLGAMVFGRTGSERIQLNEDTIWAGERRDRGNPAAFENLAEVRRLLFAGKPAEAEDLAERTMIAIPKRLPPYQPLGDLLLRFPGHEEIDGYIRALDLDSGIAQVTYHVGDAVFRREVFASAVDQLLVVRLTCDRPGRISFSASLGRDQDARASASAPDRVTLQGEAIARDTERHRDERKVGVKFSAVLRVVPEGGQALTVGDHIEVRGADAATLLLAAATDFRSPDPTAVCEQGLLAADRSYARLRAAHVSEHRALFRRVDLELAGPGVGGDAGERPTDERLTRLNRGEADPALVALYFQFGRYLLIASSRPGDMPANLQGIWNERMTPAWESKYTININTEMNYWPAEVTNLAELHLPLFDLIDSMLASGRHTAKAYYGADGFVAHHNTDIWADTVPVDKVGAGLWPMGAAWLSLHLWDHFDFGRDPEFLARRAYPVMKEAALFLLDYLVEDGRGYLVTGPSLSPENRYRLPDGTIAKLCMGPTMDIEITDQLFARVVEASELLGIDPDFRRQVIAARRRLPPLRIGKYGQLQEWAEDYDEPDPGHRHISHLFALHPGNRITPRGTPELAAAARISLERRLTHGGGHTGWSRAWIINYWARLEDAEKAHENVTALLARSTLPNLLDTHPPFQIDGNFGGTAGVAEMLLQSHAGEIHLLPALPRAWPHGRFRGLRARGGVQGSLTWLDGRATAGELKATASGRHRVRPPRGQRIASVRVGDQPVTTETDQEGVVTLSMRNGMTYTLAFR